jgi:hypothetical protein
VVTTPTLIDVIREITLIDVIREITLILTEDATIREIAETITNAVSDRGAGAGAGAGAEVVREGSRTMHNRVDKVTTTTTTEVVV